jgi:hypothetical protein
MSILSNVTYILLQILSFTHNRKDPPQTKPWSCSVPACSHQNAHWLLWYSCSNGALILSSPCMQSPECSLAPLIQLQQWSTLASFLRVKASISTGNRPGAKGSPLNPCPPGSPHGYTERVQRPKFEISFSEAPSPKDESFMHFVWHDWLAVKWAILWFTDCMYDVSRGYRIGINSLKENVPCTHKCMRWRASYGVFIARSTK